MYFTWCNNPRGMLSYALNWTPAPEIKNHLDEVSCFMTIDEARNYERAYSTTSKVSVLNKNVSVKSQDE